MIIKYKNNFYKQLPNNQWLIGVHNNGWTWFNFNDQSVIKNVKMFGKTVDKGNIK